MNAKQINFGSQDLPQPLYYQSHSSCDSAIPSMPLTFDHVHHPTSINRAYELVTTTNSQTYHIRCLRVESSILYLEEPCWKLILNLRNYITIFLYASSSS